MTRPEFLEEITDNFTELYVETFTIRYLTVFKEQKYFEIDFVKSFIMIDKMLKEKSSKQIDKNNEDIKTREEFLETITNQYATLYIKTFTTQYSKTFKEKNNFEKDYVKSLSMVEEKLAERFVKKIEKIKVIRHE